MFSSDFKKFFTHLAVHCCEVEVEGKRRAGSPLLALSGRRVNLAALLLVLIYAAEIYESKPPKSRALRHSCSCFEAVRKLLAANQSSRVDTPRRTPPPRTHPQTPARFEPTCGELIHRCGGRLTATSSEPPLPDTPSSLPPPPMVAISFQAPLALWRRGQTGKRRFFSSCVCASRLRNTRG